VTIAKEQMENVLPQRLEHFICDELRRHSIPVNGHLQFNGVKTGVLRVNHNPNGSVTFDWWPSAKDAADDGVRVPDSPKTKDILV